MRETWSSLGEQVFALKPNDCGIAGLLDCLIGGGFATDLSNRNVARET